MFSLDTIRRWADWNTAHSILERGEEMGFFRKDSKEEDQLVTEAHNVILDTLSNADSVGQIELMTGRNLREQLTVDQAEEMHKERELRGWGWTRN